MTAAEKHCNAAQIKARNSTELKVKLKLLNKKISKTKPKMIYVSKIKSKLK